MNSLLLKNCRILLPDHSVVDGNILIENGKIAAIGEIPEGVQVSETKDLRGALVMPGLVNAHGHTAMTLVRGLGGGLPLKRWLEEAIFPVEAKMSPADIEAGVTWGVMEMLAGGTTCVADMYDFPDAGGQAFENAGFKANICRVGLNFVEGRLDDCVNFTRKWNTSAHAGVVADVCIHSEYLTDAGFCRELAAANRELGRPLHVHVSETRREHEECIARHGKTPMAYLADTGILEHGAYAAHCVWATDDDFRIMRECGVTLVHNPSSNMKLGSGFARIAAAKAAGVNIALGTDGCASNDNLNMFEEMHLASLIHKGLAQDPTVLQAGDVLDMATVNAARAIGRTDTGTREVGKRADLCVIDMDRPHLTPALDVPNILAYSAQASDVVMTIVDGNILYDHGEFVSIYAEKAKYEFLSSVKRIFKSFILCAGVLLSALTGCMTPEQAEESADKTAEQLTIAAWEKAVGVTNIFGIAYEGDPIAPLVPDTNGVVRLSLEDALRVGAKNNRQFRTHKETVFIRALSLDSEEYAFSTTFSGMILGALSGDPEIVKESARVGGDPNLVRRKFEQGAVMTGNAAVDIAKMIRDDWHSFAWTGDITMSIPLMRGAGRDIVREPLTQAERNLVYSIWTFERYRQTFALSLAKSYFNVLKYYQNHLNSGDNVKRLEQNYSRAEMMFEAGRMDRIQTDQAKTDLLNARQTMITTKQSYQDALDNFKITLGLPPETPVELRSEELRALEERMEKLAAATEDALADYPIEAEALAEAVVRRRDLAVVRGETEDAVRQVKIKADALRADLSVEGGAAYNGGRNHHDPDRDDSVYDSTETEAKIKFSMPWDRRRERNQYRQALVARDRAERDYVESEDGVKNEVRAGYRDLVAMRALYGNKVEAYKTACMRVEANDLFMQSGRSSMRDILEAESALLSARNALCSAVIDWWTSDLELRCATGGLEINRDGTWR